MAKKIEAILQNMYIHTYTHTQMAKRKELAAGPLPAMAKKIEAILQKNGYKYSAGDELTISDLAMQSNMDMLNVGCACWYVCMCVCMYVLCMRWADYFGLGHAV